MPLPSYVIETADTPGGAMLWINPAPSYEYSVFSTGFDAIICAMPGIRITQGSDLQITNIRIPLDSDEALPPLTAHLRMDMYRHWLLEAVEAVAVARIAAAAVRQARSDDDDAEVTRQMDLELRASMRAISSAAFALDALYASVKARSPAHPHEAAWRQNRTARTKQMLETFRLHLKLRQEGATTLLELFDELFRFRSWAVHPASKYGEAVYRADVDSGVEWHYVAFSAKNAVTAVNRVVQAVDAITVLMYRGGRELTEHKSAARTFMSEVRAAYESGGLPPFEWVPDRNADLVDQKSEKSA